MDSQFLCVPICSISILLFVFSLHIFGLLAFLASAQPDSVATPLGANLILVSIN
jgi:hypothetical protein